MFATRTMVLGSLVCAALTSACAAASKTSTTGDGSTGGGADANSGAGEGDAQACPTGGEGELALEIVIAKGVDADVLVDGDETTRLTTSGMVSLPAGEHTLTTRRVTVGGDIVGRAYSRAVDAPETTTVCVRANATTSVELNYMLEPGSERLWVLGGDDYHAASYASDVLDATGTPDPSVTLAGGTTNTTSLAFDRAGSLWIADRSGRILGYHRGVLGMSQASAPAIVLEGSAVCAAVVPCGPRAIAFDAANDMWLAMPHGVVRISSVQLAQSGEPQVSSTLSGESIADPEALAFDKAGALWIANGTGNTIVKFAATRLGGDDSEPADASFFGQTPSPVISDLGLPTSLAFDAQDNLWVGYFGPNIVARYTPTERNVRGALTPAVQLQLGVLALVEGIAFDDAGNLWLTGKQGKVVRLAAPVLETKTSDLSAGLVELTVQGYALDLAFDPPAANTPLAR